MSDSQEDLELLESFVTESVDFLDEVEPNFIQLAEDAAEGMVDYEIINTIFRMVHSMKGSAGFINLNVMVGIAHEAETLLDIFRKKEAPFLPEHTDLLIETCDILRGLCNLISETGSDTGMEAEVEAMTAKIIEAIACARNGGTPVAKTEVATQEDTKGKEFSAIEDLDDDKRVDFFNDFMAEIKNILSGIKNISAKADSLKPEDNDVIDLHILINNSVGRCIELSWEDGEELLRAANDLIKAMREGTLSSSSSAYEAMYNAIEMMQSACETIIDGGDDDIMGSDIVADLLLSYLSDELREKSGQTIYQLQRKDEVVISELKPVAVKPTVAEQKPDVAKLKVIKNVRRDIRVDLDKLDNLINLVGELTIAEAMVVRNRDIEDMDLPNFEKSAHLMHRVITELQDIAMSVRMVPVAATFKKMRRLVHDLSGKLDKNIKLEILGEETEIDKGILDQIADPLVHMIRNAADHGLETNQERLDAGKTEPATIWLKAIQKAGDIYIEVCDNGRGLNKEIIIAKAIKNGLITDAQNLEEQDIYQLLFEPGFSTAAVVSDVSGRGVGMDVVKKNIEKVKGKIFVESELGSGTKFILRIPLSLATIDGMLVRVGDSRYTIPITSIREFFRPVISSITTKPNGQELVMVRDNLYPVVRLHKLHGVKPDSVQPSDGILIMMDMGSKQVCVLVDEILYQIQTVIKPLPSSIGDVHGVSGCTILGNGEVALILDIESLEFCIEQTKAMSYELSLEGVKDTTI